jgi:hypothetical protein
MRASAPNAITARRVIFAVASLWLGVAGAGEAPAVAPAQEAEARGFVERCFRAFDACDLTALEAAFAPGATIVHDDGVETTVPKMLVIVRNTKASEFTYNEAWVLVPTELGLRAVRSHYSLVTREEHSEDVP